MFCPNCGFNLGEQDLNFCKNCGYLLKKMLSVSNTRQDSDSLPSRVDSPLQQHDISYKSLRWLEAPPPPQHNKPHVSSIEHTQETFLIRLHINKYLMKEVIKNQILISNVDF